MGTDEWGIDDGWWSNDGQWHDANPDTVAAIRASMAQSPEGGPSAGSKTPICGRSSKRRAASFLPT